MFNILRPMEFKGENFTLLDVILSVVLVTQKLLKGPTCIKLKIITPMADKAQACNINKVTLTKKKDKKHSNH